MDDSCSILLVVKTVRPPVFEVSPAKALPASEWETLKRSDFCHLCHRTRYPSQSRRDARHPNRRLHRHFVRARENSFVGFDGAGPGRSLIIMWERMESGGKMGLNLKLIGTTVPKPRTCAEICAHSLHRSVTHACHRKTNNSANRLETNNH